METLKINKVCVGEALVGEGNEVAHIDLIIGPRGSGAETAFCIAPTNQKRGDNSLLSVVEVADSVKEGIIPITEANDLFICVGVFIHWDADDDTKIQDWNYQATKLALKRAVEGLPLPAEVIAQEQVVHHPLAAHDYKKGGF